MIWVHLLRVDSTPPDPRHSGAFGQRLVEELNADPAKRRAFATKRDNSGGRLEEATMLSLSINGALHQLDIEPETPVLWVLRDEIGLTGTKFGCGIAQCGACTVHVDGVATRSCQLPASDAVGKQILTIEGLGAAGLHAVQRAWIEHDAPQCGYCQSGQIMAAASLLRENPSPSDADIDAAMTNICRCGTYPRIRAALHRAATLAKAEGGAL